MAVDMKETIARETIILLFDKKIKKLTVKDIVEACHITRQAFYYHFSDIPELLQWLLQQKQQEVLAECGEPEDAEGQIRNFLSLAVNAQPAIKKGLASNYGETLERLLLQNMQDLFQQLIERQGLLRDCTPFERSLLIRYHCQAVMGILRQWSDQDTKHLDEIAHTIFLIVSRTVS